MSIFLFGKITQFINYLFMLFKKSSKLYFVLGMLSVSFANTTYADDQKITVVETRKIIESSTAHNDILKQVQKKNEEFRDEIQKSESELKKKYQELETKKNALSQDAIDKKNDEISKEVAELQKRSYGQHAALEDAYRNATQILVEKTSDIVKTQAQSKGYQIVVEKGAVIYSDKSLDITDSVLEEVNKAIPSIQVKFESDDVNKTPAVEAKKADTKDSSKDKK